MFAQISTPDTTTTSPTMWIAIVVIVLLVIAIVAVAARRRRSQALRDRFGPEYDRTVAASGSPQRAETELAAREKRHRSLDIRELTPGARDRYTATWRNVQARFVDDPPGAVAEADRLLSDVMRDRGYPVDDTEHRMDDLSVEYSDVLDKYRSAGAIAQRSARGEATTEELRQAMVSYRALFAKLLGADPVPGSATDQRTAAPSRDDSTQGVRP